MTVHSIEEATGLKVSEDTVIPLCGEWALAGSRLACYLKGDPDGEIKGRQEDSRLASCLEGDPDGEIKSRDEEVLSILEKNHAQLDFPCGQGQSIKDALRSTFDSSKLIQLLEDTSGIADLKKR